MTKGLRRTHEYYLMVYYQKLVEIQNEDDYDNESLYIDFDESATTDEIIGYYIAFYGVEAHQFWLDNTSWIEDLTKSEIFIESELRRLCNC